MKRIDETGFYEKSHIIIFLTIESTGNFIHYHGYSIINLKPGWNDMTLYLIQNSRIAYGGLSSLSRMFPCSVGIYSRIRRIHSIRTYYDRLIRTDDKSKIR